MGEMLRLLPCAEIDVSQSGSGAGGVEFIAFDLGTQMQSINT